ncbi:putative leucine-rich repeat-containing protein DDB_G0290503 [Euwallacea fornicatus]|uniref:putative leucine-rich repeat-containing protein DDB_G0290503 n=1 Tax=Euwallacea fornicatus TaxID=995702 RepID=UPI00338F3A0F
MDETPCNNLYDDKLMAYIYDDVDDSDIFAFKPSFQNPDGSKNEQDNIPNNVLPSTTREFSLILAENEELKLKIKQLENEKSLLELRISEVYKTAKAELERKDKRLLQLNDNINNMLLRKKRVNNQPHKQPNENTRNNVFHQNHSKDNRRENKTDVRQKVEDSEPPIHHNSNVQAESNDVLLISDEDIAFVQTVDEVKISVPDKSETLKMESKPELRRSPRKSAGIPKTINNDLKLPVKQVHEKRNLRDSNDLRLKFNKKINEDCFVKNDDVFTEKYEQYVHTESGKSQLKPKEQKISPSISNSERDKNHRCSERIKNIDKNKNKSLNPHQVHGENCTKSEPVSKNLESQNLISTTSNFASSKDVKSRENTSRSRRSRSKTRERNDPRTSSDSLPSSLSRNKISKRTSRRSPSKSPGRHRRTWKPFRSISPLRTHRDGKIANEQLKREEERFELRSRSRGDIGFQTKHTDRRRSPSFLRFSRSVEDTKRSKKTSDQRDRYGDNIAPTHGEWKKLSNSQKEIQFNKEENRESRKKNKTSLRRGQMDYGDIDMDIRRDVPNRKECNVKPIQSFKDINKLCKPDLKRNSNDKQEVLQFIESSSASDNSVGADTAFSDFESYMSDIESNLDIKSKPSDLNKKKESDLDQCKSIFEFGQRKAVSQNDEIVTNRSVTEQCRTEITDNITKSSIEQLVDQKLSKNSKPKEEVKQPVDDIKSVEDKIKKKIDMDQYKQRCSIKITKSIKTLDETKEKKTEAQLLGQRTDEARNDNNVKINKNQNKIVVNDELNSILNENRKISNDNSEGGNKSQKTVVSEELNKISNNGETQNHNCEGGNKNQNTTIVRDEPNSISNTGKLQSDNSEGITRDKKTTVINDGINKIASNSSKIQNDDSELMNKKAKFLKDEENIIFNKDKTQDNDSQLVRNSQNNIVLINDNSFLHDLSMSDDEDENTFKKVEPIKDDKVEMKISIIDVVVIPADSSLSLSHTSNTRKESISNVLETATESHSKKNSDNFECIEQIQEAIHTHVPRTEHTTSMVSLSELDTEELQKCLEDDIPESPILPQVSPDNVIDSKPLKRPCHEKIVRLFGSDSPVNSERLTKFHEMQSEKLGKNLADLPTARNTGATQETKKAGLSKPKMRKSRCQTADAVLSEILGKNNLEASIERGSRNFDRGDVNYSIFRNNLHYIPVCSGPNARIKLEQEVSTKKEQAVDKCTESTTPDTKIKRKRTPKQSKARIRVKMPFNEQNKKDKRIKKCKTKRAKCIGDSEKTTSSKNRSRVSKKQQSKTRDISQDNTNDNSEDIAHEYNQAIQEEAQKVVSKKHHEQKLISEFETPLTPSVKVKRKNKNITKTVEQSPKEEQKLDASEERKTQTRRITPVKIGEVDSSIDGNLMEEGTKKRKINTPLKDERPGKMQKMSVEFGISSQSPLPHIEGMLKLFEKKTSATHVYADCPLGSTKTTAFQRKLSDLAETNTVDASNDNTVNQINLDSKDVSLLGTLEKVILDNMTEYLGDKSLHSFGSEDKTRGVKTAHNETQNGNERVDKLDFSNMLGKNLNTSTPMKRPKENNEVDVPQVSTNHEEKQINSSSTPVVNNDLSTQTNGYKSYLATPMKRDRQKRVRVIQLIQKT